MISFKNELGSPVGVSKIIISSGLKKDTLSITNENLLKISTLKAYDTISVVIDDIIISKTVEELKANNFQFIISKLNSQSLPIFEANIISKFRLPLRTKRIKSSNS